MEDSWDWVEEEIKKMQDDLPQDPEAMQVVDAISVADFWKRRYDEEKMLWERKLEMKEGEKTELVSQAMDHESSIKELDFRFKELERRWEQEKLLLEDRIKSKEVEATVAQTKLAWEKRLKTLEEENQHLKIQLNNLEGIPLTPNQRGVADSMDAARDDSPAIQAAREKNKVLAEEAKIKLEELERDKARVAKEIEEKEKAFQAEKETWSKLEDEIKIMSQNMSARLGALKERETEHFVMLEDLACGFAHRVRNYLGIISGTIQLCFSNFKIEPELQEQLKVVDQNAADMLKSIEEFLSLSRIPKLDLETVNIKKLTEEVTNVFGDRIKSQKIFVTNEISSKDILIKVDKKLITEALRNIIENSIDAMMQGGSLAINAALDSQNNLISIKVADTGVGISEAHLKKALQPYFSTKKNKKGMGLTMAKRIVDLHRGTISLMSEKGKGTTVTINLYLETVA